jgi:hypothetical protein
MIQIIIKKVLAFWIVIGTKIQWKFNKLQKIINFRLKGIKYIKSVEILIWRE